MTDYEYEDPGIGRVSITEVGRNEEACIRHDDADHIHIPAAERVKAAQALAGDGYEVVEKLAEWELELLEHQREPTIDPPDVRVGDVVEVSHVVQGEVYQLSESGDPKHPFHLRGYGAPAMSDRTTVRLVSRPEPELDPEQVEEWIAWLEKADAVSDDTWVPVARELTRAGVPVPDGVTVGERDG